MYVFKRFDISIVLLTSSMTSSKDFDVSLKLQVLGKLNKLTISTRNMLSRRIVFAQIDHDFFLDSYIEL